MKNKFKYLLFIAIFVFTITACNNNDEEVPAPKEPSTGYIVNYGSYSGDKSTITAFNKESGEVVTDYYEYVNGVPMVSNVQHAFSMNGKVFFAGNNPDQLFWVDGETFEQNENGITENIIKPRFIAGQGNYMYVSCWGGDIWADENVSYIAKVNITDKLVEKKIALPGGPEGMAIANNKLYAALNYKDSVAVIDLSSEAISYIETPAVTSYFAKDNNNNLYVSLISTFSDFSENTGIGYINTSTDELEATYNLEGVSTSYVNILTPNNDFSKLYVMTTAYDADWNISGAVAEFDVAAKSFTSVNLIEGIAGLNGIAFYNDNIFCFVAETVTGNGEAQTYKPDGIMADEFGTGIAPFLLLTVK
jgi:hypothetical protein